MFHAMVRYSSCSLHGSPFIACIINEARTPRLSFSPLVYKGWCSIYKEACVIYKGGCSIYKGACVIYKGG